MQMKEVEEKMKQAMSMKRRQKRMHPCHWAAGFEMKRKRTSFQYEVEWEEKAFS